MKVLNIKQFRAVTLAAIGATALLTACQSNDLPGNESDDENAPITLSASLQAIGSVEQTTRTGDTYLTPGETLAVGEYSTEGLKNVHARGLKFICPALTAEPTPSLYGNMIEGPVQFVYTGSIFTPRMLDLDKTKTKKAWLTDNSYYIFGETERDGTNYKFTLKHTQSKLSVILTDTKGKAINTVEGNSEISIYLYQNVSLSTVQVVKANGTNYLSTDLPSSYTDVTECQIVPYLQAQVAVSYGLNRRAGQSTNIMPNLYNTLFPPCMLATNGTPAKAWGKTDNVITNDKEYTNDAYLQISIPGGVSSTGQDQNFKLYCKNIALTNMPSGDTRTHLTELKAGEHAVINVMIDPLAPISATATISDWYKATADGGTYGKPGTDDAKGAEFFDKKFRDYLVTKGFVLTADEKDIDVTNANNTAKFATTTELDISGLGISDLTGITYFTKLTSLKCNDNKISKLYLQNFADLTKLDCSNNQISSLYIKECPKLETLNCSNNKIQTSYSWNDCSSLTELDCSNNQMMSVDIPSSLITKLNISGNKLSGLFDANSLSSLTELDCSNNKLMSINLPLSIQKLSCYGNCITEFNCFSFVNLTELRCGKQTNAYNKIYLNLSDTQISTYWITKWKGYPENTNVIARTPD